VSAPAYPRVASFKAATVFRAHLARERISLEFDDELMPVSPLAQAYENDGLRAGNRFCILPMEGWDGTPGGEPSDLTRRRWRRFGESGAKLIWGGEAVAVRHDGRANPNQLCLSPRTQPAIARLRDTLVAAHRERFGSNADSDLLVGLQLTHSGRYARPDRYDEPKPLAASAHPVLDGRFQQFPQGVPCMTDEQLDELVDDFVAAAALAHQAGFAFVDIKACHGYLGHELLGARARAGRYGGTLDNRVRFLCQVIDAIRANVSGLALGVRLSAFDTVPYRKSSSGAGVPDASAGSGSDGPGFGLVSGEGADSLSAALGDARAVLRVLEARGIRWISVTAGSPYYSPHIQRPALFPPLDGYEPPEDPLRGVARQIEATAHLKAAFPRMTFVGAAYSYLQEWLPHVAQHAVRTGMTDFVGLGRVVLSYPDLPADVLGGRPLRRSLFCRTFSDCTTGPRLGLVSGCYPLDPFYAARPEAAKVLEVRTRDISAKGVTS
jgi:2,4-dienoyl-CoA reductase-like NADH-dependent reductase (Old Yellow Enzyme family)